MVFRSKVFAATGLSRRTSSNKTANLHESKANYDSNGMQLPRETVMS